MLSLSDKIRLLIFLTLDNYDSGMEEIFHPQRYLFDSFARGYKPATVRQRLWELGRAGELKKIRRDDQLGYQLTPKGRELAVGSLPLLKFRREWDGQWRLVFFDIDEKHRGLRSALRTKLRGLGFGPWQKSLWLTPFDVTADLNRFLEAVSLKGMVEVLAAKRLYVSDEKALAEKVWRLSNLNRSYANLGTEWAAAQRQYSQNIMILKKIAASLEERYLGLIAIDPGLPKVLLPDDWQGDTVAKLLPEWVKLVI